MRNKFESVNDILAAWNPIGVDKDLANDEYRGYVSSVLRVANDKLKLKQRLEDILVNKMGLEYNPSKLENSGELDTVCDQIQRAYNAA